MLLHVSRKHIESLLAHLAAQGFPAKRVGENGVEVLFPAPSPLFKAAAELEDWLARAGDDVTFCIRAA